MPRQRFTTEQIINKLRQAEGITQMTREERELKYGKVAWIKPLPPELWRYSTTNRRNLLDRFEEERGRRNRIKAPKILGCRGYVDSWPRRHGEW